MRQHEINSWWESRVQQGYGLQAKHGAALSLINPDDFPIVDLGAGTGVFLRALEERFPWAPAFGVEMAPLAIEKKVCRAPIERGDILTWRPGEQSPRTAVFVDVIEHVYDPEALLRHVATYCDTIVIACPNFSFLTARIDVLRGRIPFQNRQNRGGHVFWCRYASLLALFRRCGLRVAGERHLYPRLRSPLAQRIGALRPSLLAHEFSFRLRRDA